MWSLETSKCQGREQLAKFDLPCLVVQGLADTGVFPSDASRIHDFIGSADKTLRMLPGAHYFEDSPDHRAGAVDVMSAWIAARV
jgi:hypothetical protein